MVSNMNATTKVGLVSVAVFDGTNDPITSAEREQVSVVIFDKHQLPNPPEETLSKKNLTAIIDADITRFKKKISRAGRDAIRAYLLWKLEEIDPEDAEYERAQELMKKEGG